ncbi:MAG: acetyl-CoA carboxylase biotin carboxyl carrier protein [Saprospiraceae bacterium]|jgi:acetyl-CoA carboxylase biotin carboxyl carrier protein
MRNSEIQDLVKLVAKSGVSEIQLETDKVKLTIKNDNGIVKGKKTGFTEQELQSIPVQQVYQQPVMDAFAPAVATSAPVVENSEVDTSETEDDSKYVTIKSPMIGTAYARPSPDKDLFVNVGDVINPGDVICIVEAMKLFNEIEAEITGKIVKVLFDDQSPVEYDQDLFLVDPS